MRCSMATTTARAAASRREPVLADGSQAGGQGAAVRRLQRQAYQPAVLEPAQHDVHRLPGDERAAGQLYVGQAGVLVEELEAGVLRHGQAVAANRSASPGHRRNL